MAIINRLVWIFTSPARVFADIREGKAPWWQPWIWISVIYVIAGYFSRPINVAIIELNPGNLPPEQVDTQLSWTEGAMGWVTLGLTPLIMLVVTLAVAGLSYILVSILSEKANFKQYFCLNLYASIVSALAAVMSALVIRMKGIDAIRTAEDARFSVGLSFMAPEDGALMKAIFSSVEFFSIWAFVLIVMGLMHIFDMPRKQAIYCIIPLWIIQVIFLFIAEVTGSMG